MNLFNTWEYWLFLTVFNLCAGIVGTVFVPSVILSVLCAAVLGFKVCQDITEKEK